MSVKIKVKASNRQRKALDHDIGLTLVKGEKEGRRIGWVEGASDWNAALRKS